MELVPDDVVARTRAVWLGPKGTRLPVTWTYVQWALFAGVGLVSSLVILVVLTGFLGTDGWIYFLNPLIAGGLGLLLGHAAQAIVAPLVDSDQRPAYLARQTVRALRAIAWARGPVDPIVAALAAGLWLPVMILTPGPWLLRAPLAATGVVRLARYLVGRLQSPQRHWDRHLARSARAVDPAPITYRVSTSALDRQESNP
jgi:hypothetical protein